MALRRPAQPSGPTRSLPALIRAEQWWAFKGPPALMVVYAAALQSGPATRAVWQAAGWLVLSLAPAAAYANLLNDWTDIAQDARAGKANRMAGRPLWFRVAAVGLPLAAGCACAWTMRAAPMAAGYYGAVWLAFTLYSVRPFRLKCRRLAGVAADALGAHLLLTLFALAWVQHATGGWASTHAARALCAMSLLSGVRGILIHQLLDRDADRRGAVATFVAGQDPWAVRRVVRRVLLPLEAAVGLALLFAIGNGVVTAFVAVGLLVDWVRESQLRVRVRVAPELTTDIPALLDIYDLWLPVGLLVAFALRRPEAWWLAGAHLALFPGHAVRAARHIGHFVHWRLRPFVLGAPFAVRPDAEPLPAAAGPALTRDANVLRDGLHVVLAPPKTGSSTVAATLAALPIPGAVRRVHTLSTDLSTDPHVWDQAGGFANTHAILPWVVEEIWRTEALVRMKPAVAAAMPGAAPSAASPVHLVVPIREPVARYLSSMFYYCWYLQGDGAEALLSPERVAAHLADEREYPVWAGTPNWWSYDVWLDRELRDRFGIDAFAEPFDTSRGWQVYDGRTARALVIRQENLAALAEALESFYSLPAGSVAVTRANEAADHAYAHAYRRARTLVRLPEDRLTEVYNGRFAAHFYDESERREMTDRWSGPAKPA